MSSQADRRKETIERRKALRDRLLRNCPKCEVPGCRRSASDMHHVKSPGKGMKDDNYQNLSALCHEHHMQMDAPNWSKERWAAEFFWGGTYEEVAAFIALRRRIEEGGSRAPRMEQISMMDMDEDVMKLAVKCANHVNLKTRISLEDDDAEE